MKILPMLTRLEHALGCAGLSKQMMLIPKNRDISCVVDVESGNVTNLVVGYNGSPESQTALDLTLWIAHQTRIATSKPVTVQVVYVIDVGTTNSAISPDAPGYLDEVEHSPQWLPIVAQPSSKSASLYTSGQKPELGEHALEHMKRSQTTSLVAELPELDQPAPSRTNWQIQQFEQADRILWQARHLANEWRGSLKTHLRFGSVAEELCQVAIAESATVLLVGCESADHPVVQSLKTKTPCPVLGIPAAQ